MNMPVMHGYCLSLNFHLSTFVHLNFKNSFLLKCMFMFLHISYRIPPASVLRSDGKCPLTPEEAVLMLAALGFKRKTRVYIAGADIYGGKSRMAALKSLYPNLTTKESLLSSSEIEPFRNSSSQVMDAC